MNYVERTEILCVRVLCRVLRQYIRQYHYMFRSLYVTLVLLLHPLGVNYYVNYTSQLHPNKQSHIVCVLSLSFNITIPYKMVAAMGSVEQRAVIDT